MSQFVPDPTFPAKVIHGLLMQTLMGEIADDALEVARRLVPVETGALQDSLHVEDGPDGGKRVVAGTDHWSFVEFGTSDMAPEPYLRPSLDAIGLHR